MNTQSYNRGMLAVATGPPNTLDVEPSVVTVEVGQTVELRARYFGSTGNQEPTGPLKWNSYNPKVLIVTPSADGASASARATEPFGGILIAVNRDGGASDTVRVVAVPATAAGGFSTAAESGPPDTVRVEPATLRLEVGQTATLRATWFDGSGRARATAVRWASNHPGLQVTAASDGSPVATVHALGAVQAVGIDATVESGARGRSIVSSVAAVAPAAQGHTTPPATPPPGGADSIKIPNIEISIGNGGKSGRVGGTGWGLKWGEDWLKDEFAGIKLLLIFAVGVGLIWWLLRRRRKGG